MTTTPALRKAGSMTMSEMPIAGDPSLSVPSDSLSRYVAYPYTAESHQRSVDAKFWDGIYPDSEHEEARRSVLDWWKHDMRFAWGLEERPRVEIKYVKKDPISGLVETVKPAPATKQARYSERKCEDCGQPTLRGPCADTCRNCKVIRKRKHNAASKLRLKGEVKDEVRIA